MAKKSCCSCVPFLSCFSCVSARNTTDASPDALSFSAIVNNNVDSTTVIAEAGAGSRLDEIQTPPLNPDASFSHPPAAASSSVEGAFSAAALNASLDSNAANGNNTNSASPIIATQEALLVRDDPQIPPPISHASTSHDPDQKEASSSEIPTLVKQDGPRSGGSSSSSTLQTVSGHIDNIRKDVAAVEGDNVNVDLDGLMKHISQLLEHIKDEEKKSSLQKVLHRYLPTSKGFFKLRDFFSEATNFFKDIIPGDAKTIVRGLLEGMGTAHLATTGLLVVANIVERFEDVSNNRDECLNLLKEMIFLAKVVKQINERQQLQERMHNEVKEALELIVEGSIKCCSQITSSKFSKFFSTSVNKEQLGELAKQLDVKYKHIYILMGIQIYDVSQCHKANLSRRYPEHAVGIEGAIREVIDLLEWGSDHNAVAVILHGFGGMGKTTLADAVFSLVNIKGCQYSTVQLFENIDSPPKITELQKLILRDLTGSENIPEIRKQEDGQRELSRVLKKVTAFIYIDNALGERELGQLLPEDMTEAKKVRLLITARDRNVRKACPVKTAPNEYRMRGLSSMEAKNLLRMEVFDEVERKLHSYKVDHIIKKCGGIPLMLKLVARALRVAKDTQEVDEVLDELDKLKGEDFGPDKIESYFFAYEKLPRECKDPFLDICSFFDGWDWDIVANIMGESELEMLARRALVTKHTSGVVSVHDVILTLGRRKSHGVRFMFTGAIQMKKFLDEKEEKDLHNIKGIWLEENRDLFPISATVLDSMHESLRILKFGNLTKIEGKCNKIFKDLIFFQGAVPYLPFNTKELKYLSYQPKDLKLLEIPRSLKHMEFDGRLHSHAFEISSRELEQFQNLRVLRLTRFAKLKKLGNLVNILQELTELTLSYCQSIEELPSSISMLPFLRVLRMDYCLNLKHLPEDIGSLNSLQELYLQGCTSLEVLPTSFEKLSLLKSLDLSSCEKLSELPQGMRKLTSLVNLSFNKCSRLTSIPESIGGLKSLTFSMDMSFCSSLKEFPDLFLELENLRELNLCECRKLTKLPKSFSQLKCLVKLNLSKCILLKRLCDEFHCLSSLEILDLSGCGRLQELPQDFHCMSSLEILDLSGCKKLRKLPQNFHCLTSLQNLYLSGCEKLRKLPQNFHCLTSLQNLYLSGCEKLRNLPQNFHCLPSLQHLYLCHCSLEEKCMDNMVEMKTLQIMNIEGSYSLVKRWEEIQRQGNQSLSFAVYTGKDLSKEEKENILEKLLSELDCLLIDKRGNPFHICDLAPNTLSLVMFHSDPNDDFPCPLLEETIDDIQINFKMIYIGRHFNQLPGKVKDKIWGYSREVPKITLMVVKFLLTLDADDRKSWLSTLEKNVRESWLERYNAEEPLCFRMEIIRDGKDGKNHSCWKVLSKCEMEDFVLSNCGRYLKLKQLVETSQESNIVLLRELFATHDEESNSIFQKKCTSNKDPTENSQPFVCGVDNLKGKTILLEMRSVEDSCNDSGLRTMCEMYLREKETLDIEIISIPIVQPSTIVDVLERFSRKVPWLVYQNPWTVIRAVKYFLVKQCTDWERDDRWYPNIFWIIEPNGKFSLVNPYMLLRLNDWGSKAYPLTYEKLEELRECEWTQWQNMSNLEFLFSHLDSTVTDQVKRLMFQGKPIICLYGGKGKLEFTSAIRNALIELRDRIHSIYIPQFDIESTETLKLTDNICKGYYALESCEILPVEMEGTSLLNLSEHFSKHEILRFWMRLFYLKKEINGMDGSDNQLCEMKRLFSSFQLMDKDEDFGSFQFKDYRFMDEGEFEGGDEESVEFLLKEEILEVGDGGMTFMDEDGKMVAACRGKTMGWIFKDNNRAKRLMQLLVKVSRKEGKQKDQYSSVPDFPENMKTAGAAADQENVDVNSLSEYTSELLGMEQLYGLLKFNKEGGKSPRPKAAAPHYWPTSRGFSMLKNFLSDGTNANWVKNIVLPQPKEEDEENPFIDRRIIMDDDDMMLKAIINSLVEGIGEANLATAGFLMIADILERVESLYANREEHLRLLVLLDEMYRSVMWIKQFDETWPGLMEQMKNQFYYSQGLMVLILMAALSCCTGTDHSVLIRRIRRLYSTSMCRYGAWSVLQILKHRLPRVKRLWGFIYLELKGERYQAESHCRQGFISNIVRYTNNL